MKYISGEGKILNRHIGNDMCIIEMNTIESAILAIMMINNLEFTTNIYTKIYFADQNDNFSMKEFQSKANEHPNDQDFTQEFDSPCMKSNDSPFLSQKGVPHNQLFEKLCLKLNNFGNDNSTPKVYNYSFTPKETSEIRNVDSTKAGSNTHKSSNMTKSQKGSGRNIVKSAIAGSRN